MPAIRFPLLLSLALASACASTPFRPRLKEVGSETGLFVTSAIHRQTYVLPVEGKPNQMRICAEPMPDAVLDVRRKAALDAAHKGAVTLKNINLSIEGDHAIQWSRELSLDHKELAGRDGTVLLAREFMYRMCELTLNFTPGSDAYAKAAAEYGAVAAVIKDIAAAEKVQAESRKLEAEVEQLRLKAKVDAEVSRKAELVGAIRGRVTTGAGTACKVEAAKLEGLVKEEAFAGVRDGLKTAAGCEELGRRLTLLDVPTLAALEQVKVP